MILISYREECEELRSQFSKQTRDEIFKDRQMQIQMKEEEKKRQYGIENFYANLWEADTKAKEVREEMETKERLQRDRECLEVSSKEWSMGKFLFLRGVCCLLRSMCEICFNLCVFVQHF